MNVTLTGQSIWVFWDPDIKDYSEWDITNTNADHMTGKGRSIN